MLLYEKSRQNTRYSDNFKRRMTNKTEGDAYSGRIFTVSSRNVSNRLCAVKIRNMTKRV